MKIYPVFFSTFWKYEPKYFSPHTNCTLLQSGSYFIWIFFNQTHRYSLTFSKRCNLSSKQQRWCTNGVISILQLSNWNRSKVSERRVANLRQPRSLFFFFRIFFLIYNLVFPKHNFFCLQIKIKALSASADDTSGYCSCWSSRIQRIKN